MKRKIIILLTVFFRLFCASATEQVPDKLIAGNDTLYLRESPFENQYEFNEKIKHKVSNFLRSDCWDGFWAEWQIIGDKLYLTHLKSCKNGESLISEYEKFYGENHSVYGFESQWVSGMFWGEYGKLVDFDFQQYFENETKLTIKDGKVIDQQYWKAKKCVDENWESYLSDYIYKNINWDLFDESDLIKTEIDFQFHTNKEGKIIPTEFKNFDFQEKFKIEIIHLLERLDCWNQYFYMGKPIEDEMYIHLEFDYKKKRNYAR